SLPQSRARRPRRSPVNEPERQATPMAIKFASINYHYPGSSNGVFDIDLDIQDGEFLAVIGPSGSGKTTLLRLLSGFAQPGSGTITVDGRDITHLPPEKRSLGIVFQSYGLFP